MAGLLLSAEAISVPHTRERRLAVKELGKQEPERCSDYATGNIGSPVKERFKNMPVNRNLVGATTGGYRNKKPIQRAA